MPSPGDTRSDLGLAAGGVTEHCQPGIVWIFVAGKPALWAQPLVEDRLIVGRDECDDERISRRHAEVSFAGGQWRVRDLGSRNGTFVDGRALAGSVAGAGLTVVRAGHSVGLFSNDVRPYASATVTSGEITIGPTLERALGAVARAAQAEKNVLLRGESGVGKELAARRFHAASARAAGPFVAVNCAAIPHGIAERLLFGAKRGAYSGADADAPGHVQAAAHGVLFLDEIAELDLAVQAKLLRLLESKELVALGSARPSVADVLFCFATHRNLRDQVAHGTLRADLYYRIAEPEVIVPPLRERAEEIPWLVTRELKQAGAAPHASLIEACVLRTWPGNVRELRGAVRAAAERAAAAGAPLVHSPHLPSEAGAGIEPGAPAPASPPTGMRAGPPSASAIESALADAGGNIAAAARLLGLHRNQLYRLMARLGLRGPTD